MTFRLIALPLVFLALSACKRQDGDAPLATPVAPASGPPVAAPAKPSTVDAATGLGALLRADDTLATAKARLGDANVASAEVDGAEGETFPGWVLYPQDPERRVEVFLDEAGVHPSMLRIRSEYSTWVRADGIRIGMTSNELQALNGRSFEFSGFDWDYGGAITDWHGGKFAAPGHSLGAMTLCPPEGTPEGYPSGDSSFMSDLPVVVAHPPTVCEYGLGL